MSTKVYLSTLGKAVDPPDARVSVFDRGFLYGDSIYETMRTAGGRTVELRRHLARLHTSADGIGLPLAWTDAELAEVIDTTHRASDNEESYVRLIVTRGEGPLLLDPRHSERPTLVVIVQPLRLPPPEAYTQGIAAVVVDVQKSGGGLVDPRIKTGNYLSNILALRQAIERAGDDAILCNAEGNVAEGATSNVFAVIDDRLVTPPIRADLLPGITRMAVVELATELGLSPQEATITPDALGGAQEVFLTSSVRGIMPVTRVDGSTVGDGTAGPITRRLMSAYAAYLDDWKAGRRS